MARSNASKAPDRPAAVRWQRGDQAPFDTLRAQDQAPSRRELTVTVKDFRFTPDRLEVVQDDLVRVTIISDDLPHSFNVDESRIARRVAAKGRAVVEFRADRVGTFPFYCNLTSEPGHDQMRGQLVVRPK
ncbi:MAG: cupredoxin domain-containing protein [Vicinamibacterales bacterium]